MPDGNGGSLWHPSRLSDFHDLPAGVLERLGQIHRGGAARREGPQWWAKGDDRVARNAHIFMPTYTGQPEGIAPCGYDHAADPKATGYAWYRSDGSRCMKCDSIASGRPLMSGDIGGIDLLTGQPIGEGLT
jgi:hypothetical protein